MKNKHISISKKLNSLEMKSVIKHTILNNILLSKEDIPSISIEITGLPGIAKTSVTSQSVKELNEERNLDLVYVKRNLSEMSVEDLIGYPLVEHKMVDSKNKEVWVNDKVINIYLQNGYKLVGENKTIYSKPDWIQPYIDAGKKIVLNLDDYNRGNIALLQAVMELSETGKYSSWELPKGSTVILTSNPENGDFIVTSSDDAQKTRKLVYEMIFDKKCWIEDFAVKYKIPADAISFIDTHPEVVYGIKLEEDVDNTSKKANIRVWTKFFYTIKNISNWSTSESLNKITKLAGNSIPNEDLQLFVNFISNRLSKLPSIEKFKEIKSDIEYQNFFNDLINGCTIDGKLNLGYIGIFTRRFNYGLIKSKEPVDTSVIENTKKLLKENLISKDLLLILLNSCNESEHFKDVLSDEQLAYQLIS